LIIKLRDFIKRQGVVSSQQLSREFKVDEMALKPMLAIWLKKGVIKKCSSEGRCSSCSGCKTPPDYYQMA